MRKSTLSRGSDRNDSQAQSHLLFEDVAIDPAEQGTPWSSDSPPLAEINELEAKAHDARLVEEAHALTVDEEAESSAGLVIDEWPVVDHTEDEELALAEAADVEDCEEVDEADEAEFEADDEEVEAEVENAPLALTQIEDETEARCNSSIYRLVDEDDEEEAEDEAVGYEEDEVEAEDEDEVVAENAELVIDEDEDVEDEYEDVDEEDVEEDEDVTDEAEEDVSPTLRYDDTYDLAEEDEELEAEEIESAAISDDSETIGGLIREAIEAKATAAVEDAIEGREPEPAVRLRIAVPDETDEIEEPEPKNAPEEKVAAACAPQLPPPGEIAKLGMRRSTLVPKRIGSGRLVPARLTWKPGDPFATPAASKRAPFRWELMLTSACITAVCGLGCVWLLRNLLT